jgi:hypothetical protein
MDFNASGILLKSSSTTNVTPSITCLLASIPYHHFTSRSVYKRYICFWLISAHPYLHLVGGGLAAALSVAVGALRGHGVRALRYKTVLSQKLHDLLDKGKHYTEKDF